LALEPIMSRSYRSLDFAEKRSEFADRREAREARALEAHAMGFDDPEAFAALPIHGARRRARALAALNA
jgi:hypothetical protein